MVAIKLASLMLIVLMCEILAQVTIYAGGSNTCALLSISSTKCWGTGSFTGYETTTDVGGTPGSMGTNLPAVDWGTNLVAQSLTMGGYSDGSSTVVCGIVYDASLPSVTFVKCFGSNEYGKTGRGKSASGNNAVFGDQVGEMLPSNFTNTDLGTGLTPIKLVAGSHHVCAIVSNVTVTQKVKCWGYGFHGALGNGGLNDLGASPSDMGDNLPYMSISPKVLDIAAGDDFTCVIASNTSTTDGDVYCTGIGSTGQTGQEGTSTLYVPTLVNIGTGKTARKIVAGSQHVCALIQQDNQLKCWGYGYYNQNGRPDGNTVGDQSGSMGDNLALLSFGSGLTVKDVAAGSFHNCVILSNNGVRCFGYNEQFGQLGQKDTCYSRPSINYQCSQTSQTLATLPVTDLGTSIVPVSLALGASHSCAIVTGPFSGYRAKCWGRGLSGEMGNENATDVSETLTMGNTLPFVNVGEPTTTPSVSPTTSRPSHSPTKSPTTSRPSKSPTTSRPSKTPSRTPTRPPTNSSAPTQAPTTLSPAALPSKVPTPARTTLSPTSTLSPTDDGGAAAGATAGIAIGSVAGVCVFALVLFVLYRRRDSLFGGSSSAPPKNWLAEAMTASPNDPSPFVPQATAKATPQGKYFAKSSFESGNPVFAGIKESSARHSEGSSKAAPKPSSAPRLTRDQELEKLKAFYHKVDPAKNMKDVEDLADWVLVHGEEALYVKLRKKYGIDPNTIGSGSGSTPKLTFADEVDV